MCRSRSGARVFGLAYAQVGALKTLYTGGLPPFQIPVD